MDTLVPPTHDGEDPAEGVVISREPASDDHRRLDDRSSTKMPLLVLWGSSPPFDSGYRTYGCTSLAPRGERPLGWLDHCLFSRDMVTGLTSLPSSHAPVRR